MNKVPDDLNNHDRAHFGARALALSNDHAPQDRLVETLRCLRHMCDRDGVDFNDATIKARWLYHTDVADHGRAKKPFAHTIQVEHELSTWEGEGGRSYDAEAER